jgi:predicted anti-sigma-YlaC factor YlaD
MKVDWRQKLGSRKFWTALAGFATTLMTAFHVAESEVSQVALVIASAGVLAVYILAEAHVDGKRAGSADG